MINSHIASQSSDNIKHFIFICILDLLTIESGELGIKWIHIKLSCAFLSFFFATCGILSSQPYETCSWIFKWCRGLIASSSIHYCSEHESNQLSNREIWVIFPHDVTNAPHRPHALPICLPCICKFAQRRYRFLIWRRHCISSASFRDEAAGSYRWWRSVVLFISACLRRLLCAAALHLYRPHSTAFFIKYRRTLSLEITLAIFIN